MSPTTAPNFMKLTEYGEGCPDEYAARNTYKSGDLVSYSASPDRKVVYECKVRAARSHVLNRFDTNLYEL